MNELGNALRNLYDMFPVKALASMLMVIAMDSRAIIFYSFAWLVILDCFTRWLAISYKYAVETGVERPSLYKAFVGIPAARRAGSGWSRARQLTDKPAWIRDASLCRAMCSAVIAACVRPR